MDASPADRLVLGTPVARTLAGGNTHEYVVAIDGAQRFAIDVDQRGIDVGVSVFAPGGRPVVRVDTPTGTRGTEHVAVSAVESGEYRIRVEPLDGIAAAGRYRITLTSLTPLSDREVAAARDELTVLALEERWQTAIDAADVGALKALMREDGVGLERRPNVTRTRAEYLGGVMGMKAQLESGVRRSSIIDARQILVYGDTAISTGHEAGSWEAPTKPPWQSSGRFIHVWQRGPEGWALIVDHSYELNVVHPPAREQVTVEASVLATYAGHYTSDWGQALTFSADGETLLWGDPAARAPDASGVLRNVGRRALTPLSDTTFRSPDGTAQITFVRSSDGRVRELIAVAENGTIWARRD